MPRGKKEMKNICTITCFLCISNDTDFLCKDELKFFLRSFKFPKCITLKDLLKKPHSVVGQQLMLML